MVELLTAVEAMRAKCEKIALDHKADCEALRDRQKSLGMAAIEAQEQAYAAGNIADEIKGLAEPA